MSKLFSFILLFLAFSIAFAVEPSVNGESALSEQSKMKAEINEVIPHHLQDSHFYNVLTDKEHNTYIGFPLPVILIDNGLVMFSSSQFGQGEKIVERNGNFYKLYHGKIYKTDAEGVINYDEKHHPTNEKPLDFSITKNVANIILTGLIMLLMFGGMAKRYKKSLVPSGLGRFLEPIVLYVKDDIAIPNIGEKHYKRFMSFLLTIFFFIWILNIFGISPLAANVTGNITVTAALAVLTFIITNVSGKSTYWSHIFNPLGNSMPWIAKIPLYILLIPIEILGIFIKPFSLMIRLFANITAGHIVMMSLLGMIFIFKSWLGGTLSFGLSFAIFLIEFFVALLQAYIFTMLSALYFGFAVEEHHDTEEAH
ncbi:MAG: F0F1 ATP synthase subunit A [Weeksellaceae bacterium]|nr:F0F1 ATP synthase subunit A [Weeksellaceae bacterium]MDX9705681.1 F0F1 ATP synthase subunit A [Weeksellaceae bacterium]